VSNFFKKVEKIFEKLNELFDRFELFSPIVRSNKGFLFFNNTEDYRKKIGNSLILILSILASSDNTLSRVQFNYLKRFLTGNFENFEIRRLLIAFQNYRKQKLRKLLATKQLKENLSNKQKLLLMLFFFQFSAYSIQRITRAKLLELEEIARQMGINPVGITALKSNFSKYIETEFRQTTDSEQTSNEKPYTTSQYTNYSHYKTLEISEQASDREIKRAYRKLIAKYHPDKLTKQDETYKIFAKEQFHKIQHAYECIKQQKGFN